MQDFKEVEVGVKRLVMIRHAHRDTADRSQDNGLSKKGLEQAQRLRIFFQRRFSEHGVEGGFQYFTSPKLRCQETMKHAIPRERRSEIILDARLSERSSGESLQEFKGRILNFFEDWRESSASTTLVCSHGDWIPVALQLLFGVTWEIKKGSWVELADDGSQTQLKWYIPTFKYFFV